MTSEATESALLEVIDACRARGVPDRELDDMADLVRAGEPGIALQNLCTQLFEYEVLVPVSVRDALGAIGASMGIKDVYWKRLRQSG